MIGACLRRPVYNYLYVLAKDQVEGRAEILLQEYIFGLLWKPVWEQVENQILARVLDQVTL